MNIQLERIDHIVLTVKDLQTTCAFYTRVLGMRETSFEQNRKALVFGQTKINLHEAGNEFDPKAQCPTPGSADICLVTRDPIARVVAHVRANDVEIIDGPVRRTGAAGAMESVYFRDPDGNLIEVSHYDEWSG